MRVEQTYSTHEVIGDSTCRLFDVATEVMLIVVFCLIFVDLIVLVQGPEHVEGSNLYYRNFQSLSMTFELVYLGIACGVPLSMLDTSTEAFHVI